MRCKDRVNWRFPRLMTSVSLSVLINATGAFGQASYYISSSGNDANDGKSVSTPWRSIAKVDSVKLVSGDAVLFRCGDEFQGQINLNQSGVTLSSYGSGAKPIITGAQRLTGWSHYGPFYVTRASATVKNLFANGVQMTLARYPNSGLLTILTTATPTTLTATAINQADHYWDGANIRVRTASWQFETRTVTYDGTALTLASATDVRMKPTWGFYLDNVLAALDTAGEWYCDTTTNSVYFWAPGGVDPNTLTVEGSVLDYGVNSSQSNITVQGLEFRCQAQAGIRFYYEVSNIQILSNKVFGGWKNGIQFDYIASNCTIDSDTIQNINGIGIRMHTPMNCTISNNVVKNVGLVQGYGKGGNQGVVGILTYMDNGTSNIITGNTVDSIGYAGIIPQGKYNLVENNIVTNTMLKLADGGAVYVYGADGTALGVTIRNNIINNVVGNNEGTDARGVWVNWSDASGIYLDAGCQDMIVEGNTIIRAGSLGMNMNIGSCHNTLRQNTVYDCSINIGGANLLICQDTTLNYGQNTITKNIFYPSSDTTQTPVEIRELNVPNAVMHSPGTMDSNYYCNPYGSVTPFYVLTYPGGSAKATLYSFAGWKTATGQDAHSSTGWQGAGSKQAVLQVNSTAQPMTVNLGSQMFRDIDGNPVWGSVNLAPYSSRILFPVGTVPDSLLLGSTTVHQVILQQGSNMISTFVAPNQTAFDSIFSKIKSKVTIVKDDSGKVYYPSLNINQLGSWQPYHGYQVYMNSPDTVTFQGKALLPDQNPIPLLQGWNLVSYLHNDPMSVDSALGSLRSSLTIAKNNAGQVYMPSSGVNTMGTMKPGQGYQMYVQVVSTLTYPANTNTTSTTVLSKKQSISLASSSYKAEHFKVANQETGANGIILVKCSSLKDGDEIAVSMSDGKVIGASAVRDRLAPITVWGDDAQTDMIEGARDGDKLTLLSWSKKNGRSIQLEIMSIKDGLTGETQNSLLYRKDCVWILEVLEVSGLNQMPTEYSLAQNYPNPFNPSTVFRYGLPNDDRVRLEVYDIAGRRINLLVDETQTAGYHEVRFDGSSLASGAYFFRIQAGSFSATRKLVLIR